MVLSKKTSCFRKRCLVCLRRFPTAIAEQEYCSAPCARFDLKNRRKQSQFHAALAARTQVSIKTRRPQKRIGAHYQRDKELFAQKMSYTLNGTTWWATPCCYCGDPAEAEDHVLPQSAYQKLFAVGHIMIPDDLLRIVPSCHECNTLVGDRIFPSFLHKRFYVKMSLARRYHRTLDYPEWKEAELYDLEGSLHDWIAQGEDARDLIVDRLRF